MNTDIHSINLRFDLQRADHRRAWDYLHAMDRRRFKSYSNAVILAVVDYFERYYRREEDPYFETRQREERFVEQIVEAVRETLDKTLPLYLAGFTAGRGTQLTDTAPQEAASEEAELDWAFLGE